MQWGGKKPATVNFLGFTHICARSRKGKFTVHVKTIGKRLRRGLKAMAEWCQKHRHEPVAEQQNILNAKLRGHDQYYGRPTNYPESPAVLSESPSHLEGVAESPHAWAVVDVGDAIPKLLRQHPVGTTPDHAPLEGGGSIALRNPLR